MEQNLRWTMYLNYRKWEKYICILRSRDQPRFANLLIILTKQTTKKHKINNKVYICMCKNVTMWKWYKAYDKLCTIYMLLKEVNAVLNVRAVVSVYCVPPQLARLEVPDAVHGRTGFQKTTDTTFRRLLAQCIPLAVISWCRCVRDNSGPIYVENWRVAAQSQ